MHQIKMSLSLLILLILSLVSCVFAANTHGPGGADVEMGRRDADRVISHVTEGCFHSTSANTTVTIDSCNAYVRDTSATPILKYMQEPVAKNIVYAAGDGEYWTIVRWNLNATPAGFTCTTGNPYCWQRNATQPALPADATWIQHATVAGSAVTAVEDISTRHITTDQVLPFDMTMGRSAHWTVAKGGKITLNAGITLVNGGCIEPAMHQVFFGADALTGVTYAASNTCPTVRPEMWGAKGDGTTNGQNTFFQAASNALVHGGTIYGSGPTAHYRFTSNITWFLYYSNTTFDGQGCLFTSGGAADIRITDNGTQADSGETDQFVRNSHLRNYRVGTDATSANQMRMGRLFGCVGCSIQNVTGKGSSGTLMTLHRCTDCTLRAIDLTHGTTGSSAFCTLLVHSFRVNIDDWVCRGDSAGTGPGGLAAMQIKGGIGNMISHARVLNATNPNLEHAFFTRGDDPNNASATDPNANPYPYPTVGAVDCKVDNCYLEIDPRRATVDTQWDNIQVNNAPDSICFHVQEGHGDQVTGLKCEGTRLGINLVQSLDAAPVERNISINNFQITGTVQTGVGDGDGLYGVFINGAGALNADGETIAVDLFRNIVLTNGVIIGTQGEAIKVESASNVLISNVSVLNASVDGGSELAAIHVAGASKQITITNNRIEDAQSPSTISQGFFIDSTNTFITLANNRVECAGCTFGTFEPYALRTLGYYSNNAPGICTMSTSGTTPSGSRCRIPFKDTEKAAIVVRCQAWEGAANSAYYERRAAIRYQDPTLTITEAPTPVDVDIETDTDWDLNFAVSTNNAHITAVGDTGQTVRWVCNYDTIVGQ